MSIVTNLFLPKSRILTLLLLLAVMFLVLYFLPAGVVVADSGTCNTWDAACGTDTCNYSNDGSCSIDCGDTGSAVCASSGQFCPYSSGSGIFNCSSTTGCDCIPIYPPGGVCDDVNDPCDGQTACCGQPGDGTSCGDGYCDPNTENPEICSYDCTVDTTVVNGACGYNHLGSYSSLSTPACDSGLAYPSTFVGGGPWYWQCAGINGGTNAQCMAYFYGTCGSFNGKAFPYHSDAVNKDYAAPDTQSGGVYDPRFLCDTGAPVSDTAHFNIGNSQGSLTSTGTGWSWTCYTDYGWGVSSCSATIAPPPPTPTGLSVSAGSCDSNLLNISWNASGGATSYQVYRDGGGTPVYNASGLSFQDTSLTPGTPHSYTVVATSLAGSSAPSGSVIGTVSSACPISVTLSASPAGPLTAPGTTRLTWTTTGSPTSCTASNYWSGSKTPSGGFEDRTGIPASTQIFDITCSKAGTSDATARATVVVNPPAPTVTLVANPTTGTSPLTSTLTWTVSGSNVTSCTAGGGWSGSKAVAGGNQTISGISAATTYTLYCTNAGGNSPTVSATVTPVGAISVTLSASPAGPLTAPGTTRLTWTTTGSPTSCTASNYWSGSKTPSGGFEDRTGIPASTQIFDITCSKAGTSDATARATVVVNPPAPTVTLVANPTTGTSPLTSTLTWTVSGSNVTSCTAGGGWSGSKAVAGGNQTISGISAATTYTLYCTNAGGNSPTVSATVTPTPPAVVNIDANPTSVIYGTDTSVLSWQYSSATVDSCTITSQPKPNPAAYPNGSGSATVGPLYQSTSYTIACDPVGPNSFDTVTINIQDAPASALNVIRTGQGLVTSLPVGINCGTDCSENYIPGTSVQLIESHASNRIFTGWSGVTCTTEGNQRQPTCTFTKGVGNETVLANFAVDPNYKEF